MQLKNQNITVGTDPEILLTMNGEFTSAHGLVEGSKDKPAPVQNGAIQVDGMALEFNINPAKNVQEFVQNIDSVYQQLREKVPQEYQFSDKCTAHFNPEYFKARSAEEVEMGCDADYCVYTGEANKAPDPATPMRTAGGHVHIGWRELGFMNDAHNEVCEKVVKACDVFLGLPSVLFDDDNERRAMYGCAGCYRVKPYGVEYRTLSNAWIQSKSLQEFVFNNVMSMIARQEDWENFPYEAVRDAIDSSDKEKAKELCEVLDVPIFGG